MYVLPHQFTLEIKFWYWNFITNVNKSVVVEINVGKFVVCRDESRKCPYSIGATLSFDLLSSSVVLSINCNLPMRSLWPFFFLISYQYILLSNRRNATFFWIILLWLEPQSELFLWLLDSQMSYKLLKHSQITTVINLKSQWCSKYFYKDDWKFSALLQLFSITNVSSYIN